MSTLNTGPPLRVLLVEDDEATAALLQGVLSRMPEVGSTTIVRRLDAAEKQWANEPADIVLLDLHLPDMPAAGTVAVAATWTPAPAIVAMTGDRRPEVRDRALAHGAVACVDKHQLGEDELRDLLSMAVLHVAPGALPSAEQLLHRIDELDTYVAAISHDLRSPLATAESMVQLIRRQETLDDFSPTTVALLDRISDLLARGRQYADDLLEEARIGAEARAPLDMTGIVADATAVAAVDPAHVTILALPEDLWGRRSVLVQILVNLLSNAARHADADTPRIRISSSRGPAVARIHVDDNGLGIPVADRERIFRPDFSTAGSGQGLAIVQRHVRTLGGNAWADVAPDLGGARVTVELPARTLRTRDA